METGWGGACRMHSWISKRIEVLMGRHEGKDCLEDLGVDGRIK